MTSRSHLLRALGLLALFGGGLLAGQHFGHPPPAAKTLSTPPSPCPSCPTHPLQPKPTCPPRVLPPLREGGSRCKAGCAIIGTCNEELGRCDCPASLGGEECEEEVLGGCWLTPEYFTPCGAPRSCDCSAQCAKLGLGYLREPCYETAENETTPSKKAEDSFHPPLEAQDVWSCPDGCSLHGWCGAKSHKCECFPGFSGDSCEKKHPRTDTPFAKCFNRCSGRGRCINGFCHCRPGAFGIDCSLSLGGGDGTATEIWRGPKQQLKPEGGALPPRIYIYELPPWLNVWQFVHSAGNMSERSEPLIILERLLHSEHRTTDPTEADYLFVPAWVQARDSEEAYLHLVKEYIRTTWPEVWATREKDHILMTLDNWDACKGSSEPWGATLLAVRQNSECGGLLPAVTAGSGTPANMSRRES